MLKSRGVCFGYIGIRFNKGLEVQKRIFHFVLCIIAICVSTIASADIGFENWKNNFRQQAILEGVLPKVFDGVLSRVELDQQVIELDSSQPEFTRNIWDYLNNAISDARIKKGRTLLDQHKYLLDRIEERYGVQREVILAIWAVESDFGRNYGNKNVIRSLATLAYASQSQKRLDFARKELLITLKIIQANKVDSRQLVGSWAGAMGQPQFIPSSYIQYGVDYDRDGVVNLWHSIPDTFASIANFLAESGWRRGEHWGQEVKLPQSFDWRLNRPGYHLRYQQWQELNVRKYNRKSYDYPERQASLFIPAGKDGPVFLVTHNFSVIKRYNQSSSYALAVTLLSNLFSLRDKIQAAWPIQDKALSVKQIEEIQTILNTQGHSVGDVDGKIGSKTREAIRTWQLENGFPGDGYASLLLLRNLKRDVR